MKRDYPVSVAIRSVLDNCNPKNRLELNRYVPSAFIDDNDEQFIPFEFFRSYSILRIMLCFEV